MTPPPQVPYIGSTISLLSKANIRYEGFLYTIDQKESSVALSHVKVFGTEDRQCERPVPPSDEVFEFIIFRASDITELKVIDTPASRSVPDPAIIRAQNKAPSGATSGSSDKKDTTIRDLFNQVGAGGDRSSSNNYRNNNYYGKGRQNNGFGRGGRPQQMYNRNNYYQGGPPQHQQQRRVSGYYNRQQSAGPPPRYQGYTSVYSNNSNYNRYGGPRRSYDYSMVDPLMAVPHRPPSGRPVVMLYRRQQTQSSRFHNGYNSRPRGGGHRRNTWGTGSFGGSAFTPSHVDPIPPRFTADYDFETANKEIETELSKLLIADKDTSGKFVGYNKNDSFYDDISRVTDESEDAKKEAAKQASLNRETFGIVRGRMRRGFGAQHAQRFAGRR